MHIYTQIYEFAASVGALEGYVYGKHELEKDVLAKWCNNLVDAYQLLPKEALQEFQPSCDGTIGRAIRSLTPVLGDNHEIVGKLRSMTAGPIPKSADDFQKKKWFQT